MILVRRRSLVVSTLGVLVWLTTAATTLFGQTPTAQRVLGREDIKLYGVGLKVEPASQTVPKDIATIVSTFLQAPTAPTGLPPFAPDAEVVATLRGPAFQTPVELRVQPNSPFNIPPLTIPGTYVLENVRLISGGEVLLRGTPDHATIEVIEKLLVTQVTARPLSAAEIRERGIVFDRNNYQAYNFSAAFAIADQPVNLNFPVVLPRLQGATDTSTSTATLPAIGVPGLPTLQTLIPDTLRIQTRVPNLTVVGFTLEVPRLQGQNLVVPPIPGVVVIPGDIGFLNQYFSVMLMVGNVAPAGSNLVVTDLKATIVLPPGNDKVAGNGDDPLRMAQTTSGAAPILRIVAQPGPDGKIGTADDIPSLGPGDSGNAEYLVEGRREGSHVVEMQMTGTLNGLPVGPVTINGRAAGSVLVRNPKFSLTFTHPEVVNAGEAYTLDVTVTNTSQAPANFVSLNLYPRNVSGATIVGEATRGIESIPPGDSQTVSFNLVSRITGKVTASTLDSDENVNGRFLLKAGVGELGIPLSPDSLVLPKEANELPVSLRDAALGLLGKAHAVATAPAAALPPDVRRFSRKIVIDRAVQVAEAGLRVSLHEPLATSAAHLLMDFLGSDAGRLETLFPDAADRAFEKDNIEGFDELRRKSVRGDRFADAIAKLLADDLGAKGAHAFLNELGQAWSYRPGQVAVLVSGNGQPLPARFTLTDSQNRRVGNVSEDGKIGKAIPFSDVLDITNGAGNVVARLILIAAPQPGTFDISAELLSGPLANSGYLVSIVAPNGSGGQTQTTSAALAYPQRPEAMGGGTPYTFTFTGIPGAALPAATPMTVVDPPPTVMSVVQQASADVLRCDPSVEGVPAGRVLAVLFSEEVTKASVQDRLDSSAITNFAPEGNKVVGVALQPGRRIAFIALRDPFGPFVPRQLSISNVQDLRGNTMTTWTGLMEPTVNQHAGVVSGRVLNADGTPVPFANVRLFSLLTCDTDDPRWIGISSKPADASGRYQFDYVTQLPDRIVAVNQETGESRSVRFNVQRDGQRLNVDIVYLGRGTFSGVTYDERGKALKETALKVTSLTDGSEYGTQSDALGRFSIPGVPVGNVYIEAVNVAAKAQFGFADFMPAAGAVVARDIVLLDAITREVTIKHGALSGHVLRSDGTTPVAGVPAIVWYAHNSQPGVRCPGDPAPAECAVAMATTNGQGAFSFASVTAGHLRVSSFDQGALSEGGARLVLAPDTTAEVNVLLGNGLGTVTGVVLDAERHAVAGAVVGGGLSLTTTNNSGEFTLTDVPVGRREIVAVSQALGAKGTAVVDIVEAGQSVNTTIVFEPVGSVSGLVVGADGVTPQGNVKVHLFRKEGGSIIVTGSATTSGSGGFQITGVPAGAYQLSAFNASFTDGNIVPAAIKFQGQNFRTTIRYRGAGGKITGVVTDASNTPLAARVGVSGDQVAIAGGMIGVSFERVNYFKIVDTHPTTGVFNVNGLFVGPVTVSAVGQFSPDPISAETEIPAPNAQVTVNLKLQPTSQIKGVVLLPNGVQPAGKDLVVTYKSEAFKVICSESSLGETSCESIPQGIQQENVVTDEQGRFWLPIVNPGPFTITVSEPATGRVGRVQGSVRPGEIADLSVRLFNFADVTVQVFGSDGKTPIPGARVDVRQLGYPQTSKSAPAGPDGKALFTGGDALAEGGFVVTATDLSNGFSGRANGVVNADGLPVSVKVFLYNIAGTVAGTVYAPDGYTPVANAEVIVSGPNGPLAFAVTGGDGQYSVGTVPLGAVTIDAFEARTGRRGTASGSVDANNQLVTIDVVQAGIGMVRGTVLQVGTLGPLKGWEVTLSPQSASGLTLPMLKTTTGVDGTFSFPGTTRGAFTMVASKRDVSGHGTARGWIEQDGQVVDVPVLVDIERELTGGITGIVLTPGGAPSGNAALSICVPNRCGAGAIQTTAAGDGTFTINDVPLGRFSVTAKAQTTTDSGIVYGEVAFEGDVPQVTVVLGGLARVSGQVLNGSAPAANVTVMLKGFPSSGCVADCEQTTNGQGEFNFINVPAKTFTVTAVDSFTNLKGVAGGALNPAEHKTLVIRLEPTTTVSGRVMTSAGRPAHGAVAELIVDANGAGERRLYRETGPDGTFDFPAAPLKPYVLNLSDPIGPGILSRQGTLVGPLALGDLVLDEAAPQVATISPAASARGVARSSNITITFTEPILPGTINSTNVTLVGPEGPVTATLDVTTNDTVVILDPLTALKDQATYTVRVKDVKDRVQKVMPALFSAAFTTEDITPPSISTTSPAANTGGATIYTPIRITFSEAIDSSKFTGAPITLTGPAGAIAGVTTYLFGNTVVVYTPNVPLAEATTYQVSVQKATDLAGLSQATATTFSFSTTTRTPPVLSALTPANNGQVIEGGIGRATAVPAPTSDVLFVDFYLNGALAGTDRTAPFEFAFVAGEGLGEPGATIALTAIPTDTSGNRGVVPAAASFTVVADQAPLLTLGVAVPGGGLQAKNGDRIVVSVRGVDDVGVAKLGYRAGTGNPVDALTYSYTSTILDKIEEFAFFVPATAAPGSTIVVEASAIDSRGQTSQATPVQITVVDAVVPVVKITGATTGTSIRPGQTTTVVVTANDLGGITGLTFTAGGLVTRTDTRTISPAQNAVVASFTVTIPTTAQTGESLTLDATAVDSAGNSGAAARVILPIADAIAPTVSVQTSTGSLSVTPGQQVQVVVAGEDAGSVVELRLAGSGAMTFNSVKQVTPPAGSASRTFDINVPVNIPADAQIVLSATAVDLAGNVSNPATLTLTTASGLGVTLPSSQIVRAGESATVTVQLASPAAAGGVRLDFTVESAQVATVTPFVNFAEGETTKTIQVNGVAGGTTLLRALLQQVPRASTTVTVSGGIVRGTVLDSQQHAVADAQLTVSGGGVTKSVVSGADGGFFVEGVPGPNVSVKALHPVTRLRGYAAGTMTHANGSLSVNVLLIPAGAVEGTVFLADGTTAVGSGVRVDIREVGDSQPSGTTFTDEDGHYAFPLVTLGNYVLDASATNGSRGRAALSLTLSGEEVTLPIVYLGQGTLHGVVKNSFGAILPGAPLTLKTWDAFGTSAPVVTSAGDQGEFSFQVPVGSYSLDAKDPATGQAGSITGDVTFHEQDIERIVSTASYASLHGKVFRAGGTAPVVGARVMAGSRLAITNEGGEYRFEILPLGSYTIDVTDQGTRGLARTTVVLNTNGQDLEKNLELAPQGRLLITVKDAAHAVVPNAYLQISSVSGQLQDAFTATAGDAGTALVERVLVGTASVRASSGALSGIVTGITVVANEIVEVEVELEPTGTITGVVYEPGGQAPSSAGTVVASGYPARTAVIGGNGVYTFPLLPRGRYDLTVFDAAGRVRARARNVQLLTDGAPTPVDFTMVGLGTVYGRVAFTNDDPAQNFTVSVRSLNPDFGGVKTDQTDGGGNYVVTDVPLGPFTVSTGDTVRQVLGEAAGVLATHNQEYPADILLQNNAVTTPVYLFDANGYLFDVRRDGTMLDGSNAFGGRYGVLPGASQLTLTAGGVPQVFAGDPIATVEDAQREVAVRESGIHGLTVTRKVFVPTDGYFSRQLELLTNPGSEPISVDVRILSGIDPKTTGSVASQAVVMATSSGDQQFTAEGDSADRWVTFGQSDHAGTPGSGTPSLAFVMGGANSALSLSQAVVSGVDPTNVTYGWTNVTVAPGQTVGLLHFVAQQTSDDSAKLTAERLVQLPPEAMRGLSAGELAAIRNFAMPADGSSTLAALPALTGTISGRVFEWDGTTAVGSGSVSFVSSSPFYRRTFSVTAGTDGRFTLTSSEAAHRPIPLVPFTLKARYPNASTVVSPDVNGEFLPGNPAATANISFTNTGVLKGAVRRANSDLAPGGVVTVSGRILNYPVAGDASYQVGGLLPGTYTVKGTIPVLSGTAVEAISTVTIEAGKNNPLDLVAPQTFSIGGTVTRASGSGAVGVVMQLEVGAFKRSVSTSTGGAYSFPDVPAGTYTLRAIEPLSGIPTETSVTITDASIGNRNLSLIAVGSVSGTITVSGGPAMNRSVGIRYVLASGVVKTDSTTTSNLGAYRFDGVPASSVTVEVDDQTNHLYGKGVGTLVTDGQDLKINFALTTNTVTLPVTLYDANGYPYDIGRSGAVENGKKNIFRGGSNGAAILQMNNGSGGIYRFDSEQIAVQELGGRQIRLTQAFNGMQVTRKIYVPERGYFARYVDSFHNPTAQPVPLSFYLANIMGTTDGGGPYVQATSTGDTQLTAGPDDATRDLWAMFDDYNDYDPFIQTQGGTAVAMVVGGTGAPVQTTRFGFQNYGTLSGFDHNWEGLVVLPGQTVSLLHFVVQQTSRAAAKASVERLVQLPPEALEGLSAEDIASIRNFVLPADNQSTLPALVGLTGKVTGQVQFTDGTDPYANINVSLKSAHPIFSRTFQATTTSTGNFTFTGSFANASNPIAIALDGYEVKATIPVTLVSKTATGAFGVGEVTAATNVVMNNVGSVTGTVKRSGGATVPGVTVTDSYQRTATTNASGQYTFVGLPSGSVNLVTRLPLASDQSGSPLVIGSSTTAIVAGARSEFHLTFPALGQIEGFVKTATGAPVNGLEVKAVGPSYDLSTFSRTTHTDVNGHYILRDLIPGSFTVSAYDSRTSRSITKPVTVVANGNHEVNINLTPVGKATVTVRYAAGPIAVGSGVNFDAENDNTWSGFVATDTNGQATLQNVPAGPFRVRAAHPLNSDLYGYADGVLVSENENVLLTVTLPGTGQVRGKLTSAKGQTLVNHEVQVRDAVTNGYLESDWTDSNGDFVMTGIQADRPIRLAVWHPSKYGLWKYGPTFTLAGDNSEHVENISRPALAHVALHVTHPDGSPWTGLNVYANDSVDTLFSYRGMTDGSGNLTLGYLPEGDYSVRFHDGNTGVPLATVTGTIAPGDDEATLPRPVQIGQHGGVVSGHVYAADGSTALSGIKVVLSDAASGQMLAQMTTPASGAYGFNSYVFGPGGFVVTATAPYDSTLQVSATGTIESAQASVVRELVLPATVGSVEGIVTAPDGTPLENAYIEVVSATGFGPWFTTTSNGQYRFDNLLSGATGLSARLSYPGFYLATPVVFTAQKQVVTVNFTLDVTKVTLAMRALAGDGETAVESAELYLRAPFGEILASANTNASGMASFTDVWVPVDGLSVEAIYSFDNLWVTTEVTRPSTSQAIDVVLPMSVVRGTVRLASGAAANRPNAFTEGSDGVVHQARRTKTTGEFAVFGTAPGAFVLTVQDRNSGIQVVRDEVMTAIDVAVVRDITLPPTGTVTARVFDRDGARVPYTEVTLLSNSLRFDRSEYADENGFVTFTAVPVGDISLFAAPYMDDGQTYTSATGTVSTTQPLSLELHPPATTTVSGQVLVNGVPMAFAYVELSAYTGAGPRGYFFREMGTDADGRYSFEFVPRGPVKVVGRDSDGISVGVTHGQALSIPTTIDVVIGTGVRIPHVLQSDNGVTYQLGSPGTLNDGSINGGQPPLSSTYESYVFGNWECCDFQPAIDATGRQLTFGPFSQGAYLHTRKVFVPQSGAFARYLEIIENPTGLPMRVDLRIIANLNVQDYYTNVVVPPVNTDRTYLVLDQTYNGNTPTTGAIAHVFAGAGNVSSPARISDLSVMSGINGRADYSWQTTIPANGKVAFLHFGVVREPTNAIGAEAQAVLLVNLADPDALTGLTAEEKAMIKNFIVP